MSGHVFVAQGRMENLACDFVVIPTDAYFDVTRTFWPLCGGNPPDQPAEWGDARAAPSTTDPHVWFLDVAGDGAPRTVEWLAEGLGEVLGRIAASCGQAGEGREIPLVAVPTLGVGKGGFHHQRGEVIRALLAKAQAVVDRHDLDVAFIALKTADYAAFQDQRRQGATRVHLPPASEEEAKRLGSYAAAGRLALFAGSGVSYPAGIPTWDGLLDKLRIDMNLNVDAKAFHELGPLDQAELLGRDGREKRFTEFVTAKCTADRYALAHALLATLRCRETVTTNFDLLYEKAAGDLDGPGLIVLPWDEPENSRPWLLKMHGDVGHSGSIVLTRRDFVRYDASWRPVAGAVQTLLMSRHLLVVGASMTDDNVLRLTYEVAEFLERHGPKREIGTVLTLQPRPARSLLWEGEFQYVAVAGAEAPDSVAARQLEIFLDCLGMHACADSSYLLDPRYRALLPEQERPLAEDAAELAERVRSTDPISLGWNHLLATLTDLGLPK